MSNIQRTAVSIDDAIAVIRRNLSDPPTSVNGANTRLILHISRGFLSCTDTNSQMRSVLINELIPTIESEAVKNVFINLLNEFPSGYQHQRENSVLRVIMEEDTTGRFARIVGDDQPPMDPHNIQE